MAYKVMALYGYGDQQPDAGRRAACMDTCVGMRADMCAGKSVCTCIAQTLQGYRAADP